MSRSRRLRSSLRLRAFRTKEFAGCDNRRYEKRDGVMTNEAAGVCTYEEVDVVSSRTVKK